MEYIQPFKTGAGQPSTRQVQEATSAPAELSADNMADTAKAIVLRQYIQRIIGKNESQGITTDVSIIDLQTNQRLVSHNVDTEQFAASVNKIPIAELVLNDLRSNHLQLGQTLNWSADEIREGAGVYDQPGAPTHATVQELLFDMLNPSGNTAVRALVNHALGGAATTNQRFKNELHLQHTALQILDGSQFYVGNTTASEALSGIRQLLAGSDSYQQLVKHALVTNIYTDYGVRTQLAGNDFIVLANKVGILDDPEGNDRHEAGIIYNTKTGKSYGYAFLNTAYGESYNLATAQAGLSLAEMGRGVLRYAGDVLHTGQSERASQLNRPVEHHRVRY